MKWVEGLIFGSGFAFGFIVTAALFKVALHTGICG